MNENRRSIIFDIERGDHIKMTETGRSLGSGSASGIPAAPDEPGDVSDSLGDLDICKPNPLYRLALHPVTLSVALALLMGWSFVTIVRA